MREKIGKKLHTSIVILILVMVIFSGCIREKDRREVEEEKKDQDKINNTTDSGFKKKVDLINTRALLWVETLDVDPIIVRKEMGLKGKKKFVEKLEIYRSLYKTTNDTLNKSKYKDQIKELTQVTNEQEYHDMNEINKTQFKQDSTSYLRAWYIMNEVGLNTTFYESEIETVLFRLDAHLPSRGINQRMAFVLYYSKLGYPIEYTMEELFNHSEIRNRTDVTDLDSRDIQNKVYSITHEIFMPYENNDLEPLLPGDIEYLKNILPNLVNGTITRKNVDLLAELVMVMTYLDFVEMPEYKTGLDFLLASQNANGSFGDYENARSYYASIDSNIDVDILLYLHTTEVTLKALNEAVDVFGE